MLEPVLKRHGFIIANKPPTGDNGLFSGFQFFTVYYNRQFYCIDVLNSELSVKIYKRITSFRKQRVCKSIVIREHILPDDVVPEGDIDSIIDVIKNAPYYAEPLDGYEEQWLYGVTGLFDLDGSYSQLFIDSLGDGEREILDELDFVENTVSTLTEKVLVFTGKSGQSFSYDLLKMKMV